MAITALGDISSLVVDITTIPSGPLSGVVLTNGAAPLTATWNAGNFSIDANIVDGGELRRCLARA